MEDHAKFGSKMRPGRAGKWLHENSMAVVSNQNLMIESSLRAL